MKAQLEAPHAQEVVKLSDGVFITEPAGRESGLRILQAEQPISAAYDIDLESGAYQG